MGHYIYFKGVILKFIPKLSLLTLLSGALTNAKVEAVRKVIPTSWFANPRKTKVHVVAPHLNHLVLLSEVVIICDHNISFCWTE